MIAAVHEEALRTWPADCGPVSYAQTIAPEAQLAEQARALIAALGWSGIFNLQFIEAEAGLFLVDVNPRLYTSIGLAVAAGANLPAIWVESLLGGRPEVAPYRVGRQVPLGGRRALAHAPVPIRRPPRRAGGAAAPAPHHARDRLDQRPAARAVLPAPPAGAPDVRPAACSTRAPGV